MKFLLTSLFVLVALTGFSQFNPGTYRMATLTIDNYGNIIGIDSTAEVDPTTPPEVKGISNTDQDHWYKGFEAWQWGNPASMYVAFSGVYNNPQWITGFDPARIAWAGTSAQFVKGDGSLGTTPSALTAGTGISITSGVVANTSPDQTVSATGSNGIVVTGTYPTFTIANTKRQETYSGTSNSSGLYTVTYGTSYSAAPNVQFQINGGTNKQTILLTASSTTGFTLYVQARTDIAGLLPSYANVNGAAIDVLVTEK